MIRNCLSNIAYTNFINFINFQVVITIWNSCSSVYKVIICTFSPSSAICWISTIIQVIFTFVLENINARFRNINVKINLYASSSFFVIFALNVGRVINNLIVSVQRHPDGVTWLEVNSLAVVQSGGGLLDDVAISVGYEQRTAKFEIRRPVSFLIGASAVGNGESVSAHAKYHSRSQCYGKYFFHSLSSS